MAVRGVFASDAGIQGARRGDFASALIQVMPQGKAPLLALSSGMKEAPAVDSVVVWFEEEHLSGNTKTNGAGNTSATALVCDDVSEMVNGMILENQRTNEQYYVTAVNTGTKTATIVRAFAGTTATAWKDDDPIQRISTTQEQGSSKPTAVTNLGEPKLNYMQIFRNAWDITGTAKAISWYTGDQVAKNKADAAMFHAEDIERALIWGRAATGRRGGKPWYSMDGLKKIITTNVPTASATTTWDNLEDFFETVFRRNIKGQPNERIAFCGNTVIKAINKIARVDSDINITPQANEFGLAVGKWITPFGNVSLMTHPLMVENDVWTKDLLVLHPGAFKLRWLRKTMEDDYDRNGTRAGVDADYGTITSELTLEYAAEKTAGYFANIQAGAKTG